MSIDTATMRIIDQMSFVDFPLMPKLTCWGGGDFHMGILFGVFNQGLSIAFGTALCLMIMLGYRQWWIREPSGKLGTNAGAVLDGAQREREFMVPTEVGVLGMAMPVAGVSLLVFRVIDWLRQGLCWRSQSSMGTKAC